MPQLVTIPLGGRDFAGQPLPEQASYLVAGQGATDALPGDPYKPPGGAAPSDGMPGDPYTAPQAATPAPKREVSITEAIDASLAHGATFGAAPAIAGLSAASGMQVPDITPQTGILEAAPALAAPFVGAYNLLTGSGGEAYTKAREKALKDYQEIKAQRPYVTLGGELAGGLATLPITPFTGLKAATGLGRIAQGVKVGGVTGGLTGAGEATGRGESPLDVAKQGGVGAASGAVLGAGLGGTIEGVSKLGSKVASIRRGAIDPELEAAKKVQEMFQGPGAAPYERIRADTPALKAGSETGAPLVVGDFGGRPAGALLRAATDVSPEARDLAEEKLGARYSQQAERVVQWIRSKFGGRDTDATQQALKTQAKIENAPAYQRAQLIADRMHPGGIWSSKLEQLLSAPGVGEAMQTAMQKGGNRAVSEGLGAFNPRFTFEGGRLMRGPGASAFPDLQLWDYTQRALRDAAKIAQRKGSDDEAGALFSLHSQLLGELDKLVPAFGDARGTAAKFFRANDALEAGQNFVTDTSIRDGEAIRAIKKMSPAERKLFAQGFAGELSERLGARNYSSDIVNNMYVNSPRAERRITIALGTDAAVQFEAVLRIEGIMNKLRRSIGGSQTSTNLQGIPLIGGLAGAASEAVHAFNPAYVIAGALALGGREAARKIDEQVALHVGQMLMSSDPAVINRGYDIVSRNPVMREALRRASDLGVRELISRAGAYNVGAGLMTAGRHLIPGGKPPEAPPHQYYQQQEEPPPQLK